jgi:hypothetical protein
MQPDVARAQAQTLRELADQWEHEAIAAAKPNEGYGEVALLMRRTARQIETAVLRVPVAQAPLGVFDDHGMTPTAAVGEVREG